MDNAGKAGKLRGLQINRERLKLAGAPSAPPLFAVYSGPYNTLRRHDIR